MLINNIPWGDNFTYSANLAYFLHSQTPIFDDDLRWLGHRERLKDDEMSNAQDAIKSRFNRFDGGLKVSVESGLTVRVASGRYRDQNGTILVTNGMLLAVANNSTSYVFIDGAGTIQVSTQIPTVRLVLAKVEAVSGTISNLEDWRDVAIRQVLPLAGTIRSFGGNSLVDKVCTQGETLDQSIYAFRTFTVPEGVSIIIKSYAKIICQDFINRGAITVTTATPGAFSFAAQIGGNTSIGGIPGQGVGTAGGSSFSGGKNYNPFIQATGSGGGLGYMSGTGGGIFGRGGEGGGCLWIEASRDIHLYGSITADGGNAVTGTITNGNISLSGSGGGSAGSLIATAYGRIRTYAGSVVSLRGGNGANGIANVLTFYNVQGGGNGAGGYYIQACPDINNSASAVVNLTPGVTGATANFDSNQVASLGGGGGGGFGGAGGVGATQATPGVFVQRNFALNF